jgi:hypothetical protein
MLSADVDGPFVTLSWVAPANASGLSGYRLEGGTSPGSIETVIDLGPQTVFSTGLGNGTYYVRVKGMTGGVAGPSSNEVVFSITGAPSHPQTARVAVAGNRVSLGWQPPAVGPVGAYEIHAGTGPGLSNLGVLPIGADTRSVILNVADGTYFAHVHARNSGGMSGQSNDVSFTAGAGIQGPPGRPTALTVAVAGNAVTLSWVSGPGGSPTSHMLQVGSTTGASDLGTFAIGAPTVFSTAGVSAGRYYVRIVAVNASGASAPSEDVVVIVQ